MAERTPRRMAALAVAVAAALTLGGCVAPAPDIPHDAASGGQTQAELDAALAEVPGLVVVVADGSAPNVKGNTGYEFRLELAAGHQVADAEGLVDYLVRAAWSVRDGWMPNTSIEISLSGLPDGAPDLVQAAIDGGWVPEGAQRVTGVVDGYSSVTVWVQTEGARAEERGGVDNRRRLGGWPGDAPAVPRDAIVTQ